MYKRFCKLESYWYIVKCPKSLRYIRNISYSGFHFVLDNNMTFINFFLIVCTYYSSKTPVEKRNKLNRASLNTEKCHLKMDEFSLYTPTFRNVRKPHIPRHTHTLSRNTQYLIEVNTHWKYSEQWKTANVKTSPSFAVCRHWNLDVGKVLRKQGY